MPTTARSAVLRGSQCLRPAFGQRASHAVTLRFDLTHFQCRFLAMKNDSEALLARFARLKSFLGFGVQSTDEVVGDAVLRRHERDIAERVIAQLHARGIPFQVSLIVGLPYQTLASFERDLAWCREQGIPRVQAFHLSLLVGTGFWREQKALGLVEGFVDGCGGTPLVVETPWMSRADMEQARAIAAALS